MSNIDTIPDTFYLILDKITIDCEKSVYYKSFASNKKKPIHFAAALLYPIANISKKIRNQVIIYYQINYKKMKNSLFDVIVSVYSCWDYLNLVEWIESHPSYARDHGDISRDYVVNNACGNASWTIIKYLEKTDKKYFSRNNDSSCCQSACHGNQFEVLKFLVEEMKIAPNVPCLYGAIRNENYKMLNYLFEKIDNSSQQLFACNLGSNTFMNPFANRLSCNLGSNMFMNSFANRLSCYSITYKVAAETKNIKMLNYLYDKKIPINGDYSSNLDTINAAIRSGSLDVVKWFRDTNLHIDYNAITYAIINGEIEILQWLLSENLPVSKNYFKITYWYDQFEAFKLGIKYNCPGSDKFKNIQDDKLYEIFEKKRKKNPKTAESLFV